MINSTRSILNSNYCGRFAPSPTGKLHFGSLIATVGSYLEAKSHNGKWLIRIENLDKPREIPAASYEILRTIEILGMEWDNEVIYQDHRKDAYENALAMLNKRELTYLCACSRKEIADSSITGISGQIYAGTCRYNVQNIDRSGAIRIKTDNNIIEFKDYLYDSISQRLERDIGDFILRRSDGIYAYQLAVVVDDAAQGITNVVRGADLLDSTPRQIYLQKILGYSTPAYMHLPVAVNKQGKKLSKQTRAAILDILNPIKQLVEAVSFLGQEPPIELLENNISYFWKWAIKNWHPERIHKERIIQFPINEE